MNLYGLQKAIMKLDQQGVDDYDIDEDEEYQEQMVEEKSSQSKYIVIITIFVIAFLTLLLIIAINIAASISPLPKVHMEYHQQAFFPDVTSMPTNKRQKFQESKEYFFDVMTSEVKLNEPSPINLVQIENANSAHRMYQKTLRQLQSSSSHMVLDQYVDQRFSEYSSMTYKNYLQALDSLQLTTFAIDDFSHEYNKLSNQQRLYYSQKYWDGSSFQQNQICVVMALTKQGLQSQQYYFAIKSVFQQQYNNYRLIVLNHPESDMLDPVKKLVQQFRNNKIRLIDKKQEKDQKIGSAFYIKGIVDKYCKDTKLTVLLHDRGELIGRQAFKTINKVFKEYQPSLIFTHYILQPLSPLRSAPQTFRYKVQLYPPNLSNSRNEPYKTKYLKIYSTQMLLRLDERVMKKSDGSWIQNLFQSNLQFAMLELSCFQYYLLEEILYMASIYDMESAIQVFNARTQEILKCYLDTPEQANPNPNQQSTNIVLPNPSKIQPSERNPSKQPGKNIPIPQTSSNLTKHLFPPISTSNKNKT